MPEIFDASTVQDGTPLAPENTDTSTKVTRHVDEYSAVLREESPTGNPFAAYAAKPLRMFFESQHEEEKVLLLLRQHPITQVKYVLIGLVLFFLPFLLTSLPFFPTFPPRYETMASIGWYLLVLGFALEAFLSWFFNVYIITDERIIDVDFYALIFKNVSFAKIDKIEDITAATSGTLGSIFDFGTIKIQTAGATTELEFEHVPHPSKVAAFINELLIEEEREKIEGRIR